jgi:hypothetical protein
MIFWAQNIVQEFNKMAKHLQGYQWPTEFQYSGEFTAKPLSPISDFIVDEDTIKVIQATYSTIPLSDLADNDAAIASFSGEDKIQHGRQLLQDYCKLDTLYNNDNENQA